MASTPDPYIALIAAVLAGGSGKVVLDFYQAWRNGPPPELKNVTLADANLASVAKARDELIEDNIRLREERLEQDQRHAAERAVWLAEQARLRKDIADLELRLRTERDQANRRYDALLRQVRTLGLRTDQLEEDTP